MYPSISENSCLCKIGAFPSRAALTILFCNGFVDESLSASSIEIVRLFNASFSPSTEDIGIASFLCQNESIQDANCASKGFSPIRNHALSCVLDTIAMLFEFYDIVQNNVRRTVLMGKCWPAGNTIITACII